MFPQKHLDNFASLTRVTSCQYRYASASCHSTFANDLVTENTLRLIGVPWSKANIMSALYVVQCFDNMILYCS